jgi:hypothetical protein
MPDRFQNDKRLMRLSIHSPIIEDTLAAFWF